MDVLGMSINRISQMKVKEKIIFPLLVTILIVALIECISYATYFIIFKTSINFSKIELKMQQVANNQEKINFTAKHLLLHPYYGYVFNLQRGFSSPREYTADSLGFQGTEQIVLKDYSKSYVVAVVGGSVAYFVAQDMQDIIKSSLSKVIKNKEIIIHNFCNGGYKQPQQLKILEDMISLGGRFDLVINIDGFNETALPASENIPNGVMYNLPRQWNVFSESLPDFKKIEQLGKQTIVNDVRKRIAAIVFALPVHPISVLTFWDISDVFLLNLVSSGQKFNASSETLAPGQSPLDSSVVSNSGAVYFGPNFPFTNDDFFKEFPRHWAVCSILTNNLIVGQGGVYVHILQPNQYDEGSKVFTEKEIREAVDYNVSYSKFIKQGYPLLRKYGEKLSNSGINFFDLTAIFKNVKNQAYSDTCCHLTSDANALFVETIMDYVLQNALSRPSKFIHSNFD